MENYTKLTYRLNAIPIKVSQKANFCETEKLIITFKKFKYISVNAYMETVEKENTNRG